MPENELDPQLTLVDPNSEEALAVASVLMKSMDKMVPFHIQLGAVVRLFSSVMLLIVDEAGPDQMENVRASVLNLLSEITEAVRTWPDVPAHLRNPQLITDLKAN